MHACMIDYMVRDFSLEGGGRVIVAISSCLKVGRSRKYIRLLYMCSALRREELFLRYVLRTYALNGKKM